MWASALLLLLPLGAFLLLRRVGCGRRSWLREILCLGVLSCLGLAVASPFLTSRGVGTGEAYNYSLALADAVMQMRSGEIPVLAGQTEYAFNGRIHPLRSAPYLFYLGGFLDLLTFRSLSFWELQNLSLALSLAGAVFTCYFGLRWGWGWSPWPAVALAAIYGFCPPLLVAANVDDLFMTVHVAPFLPLALGACVRSCRGPAPAADAVLAAALAASWLAHPPVALWLTGAVAVVRGLVAVAERRSWRGLFGPAGIALLTLALAAFGFASALGLKAETGVLAENGESRANFVTEVMAHVRRAFPDCLLPIGFQSEPLGRYQLGYVCWAFLLAALVGLVRAARRSGGLRDPRWLAIGGLAGSALFLLILTLPVPGITRGLWQAMPTAVHALTNIWPMQRLYLVATALVLFAAGGVLPGPATGRRSATIAMLVALVCGGWSLFQAWPLVKRGFNDRWPPEATARSHLPSNLNLTVTSYAFLGLSATFVHGAMDPRFEFRLLKGGRSERASAIHHALGAAPIVARGTLRLPSAPAPSGAAARPGVRLEPGKRYLLNFDFRTQPIKGELLLTGRALARGYTLPQAGQPGGFGMEPGRRHALPLWTDLAEAEEVEIGLHLSDETALPAGAGEFAGFTLQEVRPEHLLVKVESFLPLRCSVNAPEDGCYLETFRRFIPGYAATVNGREVRPVSSPDRQVMVPVPKGWSTIELRYEGSSLVRAAFWLSAAAWSGFGVWLAGWIFRFDWVGWSRRSTAWIAPPLRWLAERKAQMAAVAAAVVFAAVGWNRYSVYRQRAGPIQIRLVFPSDRPGRQEPILTTGRPGAGTTVFVSYDDDNHIRIGADIWGSLLESEPLPVDYLQAHDLIISSSALFPADHPRVSLLDAASRRVFREEFLVEYNGRRVIAHRRFAFDSKVSQVAVGSCDIGSSFSDKRFTGEILSVRRLPFPRLLAVDTGQQVRLTVQPAAGLAGVSEPLLSVGPGGSLGVCYLRYLPDGMATLGYVAPDGSKMDSPALDFGTRPSREIECVIGQVNAPGLPPGVIIREGGRQLLGPAELAPLARPVVVRTGLNESGAAGVAARFTGRTLSAEVLAGATEMPAVETSGPLRLVVTFPMGRTGAREPLLVTGRAGAGDFAFVEYVDDRHVRLGLDHWGVGGSLSDPLPVNYESPHEIEISMGSLYPDERDDRAWQRVPANVRHRHKTRMAIRVDGEEVLQSDFPAHPTTVEEITVGLNRIGGSSCGPGFSGMLHSVRRLGLPRE